MSRDQKPGRSKIVGGMAERRREPASAPSTDANTAIKDEPAAPPAADKLAPTTVFAGLFVCAAAGGGVIVALLPLLNR